MTTIHWYCDNSFLLTGCDRWRRMGLPRRDMMNEMTWLTGSPLAPLIPAEAIFQTSPVLSAISRNISSATGLRVTLAVQTNNTLRGGGGLRLNSFIWLEIDP